MNHLHFVQSIEPLEGGGLGKAALELSTALAAGGGQSLLVTTKAKGDSSGDDHYKAWSRFGPTRAFYAPEMWRAASGLVAGCDVVHGHGFYVAPNWVLGRAARQQGKPLVYHVQGILEPWILARSRGKKRVAHWLFESANFRYAGLWRALTVKEAGQIRAQGITAPIEVCPNGIDLEVFDDVLRMRSAGTGKSKRELLFLGRLHPKKGLPLLVEAWAAVSSALRADWRIVVAGPDELGHQAEIEAMVNRLGLADDFSFIGSVRGREKLAVLASADAFVLPSHSEGFSVAILEAMACRLPVLATEPCNFPELAGGGGGWCVVDTVDNIKAGLIELLSASDEERRQRGELGRALVERAYTWPQIASRLDAMCGELFA